MGRVGHDAAPQFSPVKLSSSPDSLPRCRRIAARCVGLNCVVSLRPQSRVTSPLGWAEPPKGCRPRRVQLAPPAGFEPATQGLGTLAGSGRHPQDLPSKTQSCLVNYASLSIRASQRLAASRAVLRPHVSCLWPLATLSETNGTGSSRPHTVSAWERESGSELPNGLA